MNLRTVLPSNGFGLGASNRSETISARSPVYGTFTLPSFEAAASGLPLMVTRRTRIAPFLAVEEPGGMVIYGHAGSVGAALIELASDVVLASKLGREARIRESHFAWRQSAEVVLNLYASLLDDYRASLVDLS